MPTTYPNQRLIKVNREKVTSDFLGIKNENWQAASRDLGAHALQLYLYIASNANNFTLALSPAAVTRDIGMARSTYHDQFHKLLNKGYLIPVNGNTYAFFEAPPSAAQSKNSITDTGLNFENNPTVEEICLSDEQEKPQENIEINNKYISNTPVPQIKGNERYKNIQEPNTSEKKEFVF